MALVDKNRLFVVEQEYQNPQVTIQLTEEDIADLPDIERFNKDFNVPKNLIGYYTQLLSHMFSEKNLNVDVKVSYQEDFVPNNTTPLILVSRGQLYPGLQAAPGETFQPLPGAVSGIDSLNPNETKKAVFLLTQEMSVKIFSANRAELENISYLTYLILLASCDNVLQDVFPRIVRVDEPVMSDIVPYPKESDYYFTQIQWKISYKESSILLFKEKLIKYSRLIVHDKNAVDELQIKG